MQPSYKFPRSLGSLDLTDPSSVPAPPPAGGPSGSRSHPSLLVTDSSGHPQASLSDEQYLDKFTTAVNSLRDGAGPSAGLAAPNPAHLSTQTFGRSKSLSRISEYSESAYSSGSRARDSHEPPSSPPPRSDTTRSPSPGGASPIDPGFGSAPSSFSFPAPPAIYAAHLAPQGPPPPPLVPVTTPVSPRPVPSQRFHVTNPDATSPSLSPSPVPGRHHLPSRPLTTPLPLANPHPVPVPLDNFAAPPAAPRADSPQWSSSSHSHEYGSSASSAPGEYMVQLPGRAVLAEHAQQQQQQRFSRHGQEHSESSTAWATAEDEKFFNDAGGDVYAAPYHAMSFDAHEPHRGGDSPNRFTLDDEKIGVGRDLQQRRKGSDATTATATQGWEPEGEQVRRGANRRLWWALLVVVVIAVAVGVGVGVGRKDASAGRAENDSLAPASASSLSFSSPSPSSPSPSDASSSSSQRTIIRPSAISAASSAAAAAAVETYSTTFGFEQSGRSTVVPLTYTIPTSYATRADGRYQFTQQVVLPDLGTAAGARGASFTSDLRFRVAPTDAASGTGGGATIERRSAEERVESARRWDRRERDRRARVIR